MSYPLSSMTRYLGTAGLVAAMGLGCAKESTIGGMMAGAAGVRAGSADGGGTGANTAVGGTGASASGGRAGADTGVGGGAPESGGSTAQAGAFGDSGGSGAGGSPQTTPLAVLLGDTRIYVSTELWQGVADAPVRTLPDAEYAPISIDQREQYEVAFDADGSSLGLTGSGWEGVVGERVVTSDGRWEYTLDDGFAGGYLSIWVRGTTIVAELIRYGSGVPIVRATRGELRVLE